MIKDYFKIAFKSISHRQLRAWLTMIGIFIGIAAVVALISVGQGMEDAVTEQFEMMGSNKLIISPGGSGLNQMVSADKLTVKDLEVVKGVKGVDMVAEMVYASTLLEFQDEAINTLVIGMPTDESSDILYDMQGFGAEEGRDLETGDDYKVTVGHNLVKENGFFSESVGLRDKIIIKGQEFKVVGLVQEIGNPQDDNQVYIPLEVARELFGNVDESDMFYVQLKDGVEPSEAAEDIKKALRDLRGEEEGKESFGVQTFEQLLEQVSAILGIIQIVLIGIAGISLLVGGIGIMNTMYTSVLERTKDIGIMKAIGAKNSDILLVFLFESGLYGLVGGIIGVILGLMMSFGVEKIGTMTIGSGLLNAHVSFWLIFGALLFSFLVGTLSGIMPARQAAKMKPVDALRYE